MLRMEANFEGDWVTHLRKLLILAWGEDQISRVGDEQIPVFFFDTFRRRISPTPRVVKVADDFVCPVDKEAGWELLKRNVEQGLDLTPHFSEGHLTLLNTDGLLNEWGVHHFHLGTERWPKKPKLIKRTGPLVCAYVTEDTFYAIQVLPHRQWARQEIVESLHRNWPEAIEQFRIFGIPAPTISERERITLRDKTFSAPVSVSDGTVYGTLCSPVSCAGTSIEAVRRSDMWRNEILGLQIGLENKLREMEPTLKAYGHTEGKPVKAELRINDDGYFAYLPELQLTLNITLVDSADG
ncbi:hypothetical protein [Stutzerimonas kunmingensis]|uniref:hypothetical protein n=1 Tax=Stutzerimonas kunmingensis TaxID=1211807 RepID=UPI0028A08FAA|nr:hypothetical protein [Stutzerimonas kunmingensis]